MMDRETSDDDEGVELPIPATRDKKGRLLPGQRSINPAGRPPVIRDIKIAARSHTRQALVTLVSVMNDRDAPASARVSASEAILNRGWGRPQQRVEARIAVTDIAKTHADVLRELHRKAVEAKQARIAQQLIDITPTPVPSKLPD